MADAVPEPSHSPKDALLRAFCALCQRTTYFRKGAEVVCPVCSSPLVAVVTREADPEAS